MKKLAFRFPEILNRLKNADSNPRSVALGYSLGVFVAATPLMGIHCLFAVIIARILRCNIAAAGIGALHSNIFTAPLLYGTTYIIGSRVMGITRAWSMPQSMTDLFSFGSDTLIALTLGGLIIGIPYAFFSYFLTFRVIKKYQIACTSKKSNHENKS